MATKKAALKKKSAAKKSSSAVKKKAATPASSKTKAAQSSQDWSWNVPAHASVWAFLGRFDGLVAPFPDAPTVKLRTLGYWNAAPGATNDTAANDLALRMDDYFANDMMVDYHEGQNVVTSVQALKLIARKGDNTVRDLALAVDATFKFAGEV